MSSSPSEKFPVCCPKCFYFPPGEPMVPWLFGEDGLKHRQRPKEFICGYDGHTIKNWSDPCPRLKESNTDCTK